MWASDAGSAVKTKLVTTLHHVPFSAVWAEEHLPLCKALEVLLRYIALPSARSAGLQKGPGLQRKPCTGFNQVLIIHAHVYCYFKSSLKTPRLGCLLNRTFSSPVTGEGGGKGSGLYPVLVWGPGGRWRPPALLSMLGEVAGMGTAPAHQGWAGDHGKCQ